MCWALSLAVPEEPELLALFFTAAGKALPWRRDEVDMYAVHCTVPEGALFSSGTTL